MQRALALKYGTRLARRRRQRGRAGDLVRARRAPWRLLRPRHTPACSVAIRRPGPLLLLLPPVPARHPAGPPTPAEQGAGQETWSGHAGAPGACSGRATPLLARWQSGAQGAQGPCSCCCHPCRHGTRLARRRRQSKGPGRRLGQGTPGPLAPAQAAPHPCLLGGNPAPRAPAPAAATRAGTAPGWPADAGRARGRVEDLVRARRAPWRLLRPRHTPACSVAIRRPGPLLLLLPPVPARHPAGPPAPAEQGAGQETCSGHAGPPGACSGRATPLLARWQSGAQGPCSCCLRGE